MRERNSLSWLSFILMVVLFNACKSPTESSSNQVVAPSPDLSASAILAAEGISTIHFIEYDSAVVNGKTAGPFSVLEEVYLDTTRVKIIDAGSTVAVYDLRKGIAWNYEGGQLTYMQLPDLQAAYDGIIQGLLASGLKQPAQYLGTEEVEGKLCSVFRDSTGSQEWIWNQYRLPLQRKTSGLSDRNVYVTSVVQRRGIHINVPLSDSIFAVP